MCGIRGKWGWGVSILSFTHLGAGIAGFSTLPRCDRRKTIPRLSTPPPICSRIFSLSI